MSDSRVSVQSRKAGHDVNPKATIIRVQLKDLGGAVIISKGGFEVGFRVVQMVGDPYDKIFYDLQRWSCAHCQRIWSMFERQ